VIGLLFTGGTISMRVDPATGAASPALGAREILAQVPQIETVADIESEDFARLPGPHVTPEQMWRLARRAAAWLERPDVDGLVVTHGTDTLEETAFFLDLVLTASKPVVFVGAMRTVSDPSWDGPANLLNAIRVAAAGASAGRGVLVAMNEQILSALEAQKVHTESPASFASPEFGPLGVIDAGCVRYHREPAVRADWGDPNADAGLRVQRYEPHVDLVTAVAGSDDRHLQCSLATGARGLVVQALGRGNVPPAMRAGIAAATERGVPVVIVSRSPMGAVRDRYGYEGGGRDLKSLGAIFAPNISGPKARVKLMVLLVLTDDGARLRAMFEGEP